MEKERKVVIENLPYCPSRQINPVLTTEEEVHFTAKLFLIVTGYCSLKYCKLWFVSHNWTTPIDKYVFETERRAQTKLLIGCQKLFTAVSTGTISGWLAIILKKIAVKPSRFSTHNTKSATTTTKPHNISIVTIMSAVWVQRRMVAKLSHAGKTWQSSVVVPILLACVNSKSRKLWYKNLVNLKRSITYDKTEFIN